MKIQCVTDAAFSRYGQVLSGYDFAPLIQMLHDSTPKPDNGVVYVPSDAGMETLDVYVALRDRYFGGMPIQIGYCNGSNTKLNCCEYHRDSEVNVAAEDAVFLLGLQSDIKNGSYDTGRIEAFFCPAGTAVELFATTLHYAPCDAKRNAGFRMGVVLPRDTNTQKPEYVPGNDEDKLMMARNKWLLAHVDSNEAKSGAVVGLIGENIDITDLI